MREVRSRSLRLGWRSLLLLVTAGAVAGALWVLLGPPSQDRLYRLSEIERFRPTLGHGLIQLAGETLIVVVVAWLGRRWLRLRL